MGWSECTGAEDVDSLIRAFQESLAQRTQGWKYDPEKQFLALQVFHETDQSNIVVEWG